MLFTQSLDREEQRGLAEGLTDELLAIYDLLTRPGPDLTWTAHGVSAFRFTINGDWHFESSARRCFLFYTATIACIYVHIAMVAHG
jgi:hypothetical protein